MPIEAINTSMPLAPLARLEPLAPKVVDEAPPGSSGFASVLSGMLARNQQANAAADAAIADLATGKSQDLHTVALAISQADVSFRLILEMRNRLSDAFQEISRMTV